MEITRRLNALGVGIPEICLPREHIDLEKWAVIACDQFTQDRDFWLKTERIVGDAPSTLRLILPEIYLNDDDRDERIAGIRAAMEMYLAKGVLAPPRRSAIYLERTTAYHSRRRGLMLALDLEKYNWKRGAKSYIRATEDTVPERIPPRMTIRRGAPLELPHILILIDDREDILLPTLGALAKGKPPLYETSLMQNGGKVTGWALDSPDHVAKLAEGLEGLAEAAAIRYADYGAGDPFLFAVGDGNHSLAAAKAVWEESPPAPPRSARWALTEIVNLYDPGLSFEPIHRLLFGPSREETLRFFAESGALPGFAYRQVQSQAELSRLLQDPEKTGNPLGLIAGEELYIVETHVKGLLASALQPLLDRLLKTRPEYSVDYIHGEDELFRLAGSSQREDPGRQKIGVLLPPIRKEGLFETIARSGPLPRKSFSLGAGIEKRFYLECRKLVP